VTDTGLILGDTILNWYDKAFLDKKLQLFKEEFEEEIF
jgi:hypothetical protein